MARLARALALYALATAAIALFSRQSLILAPVLLGLLVVTYFVDHRPRDIWFPVGGFVSGLDRCKPSL